jgi:hypothetical protein
MAARLLFRGCADKLVSFFFVALQKQNLSRFAAMAQAGAGGGFTSQMQVLFHRVDRRSHCPDDLTSLSAPRFSPG